MNDLDLEREIRATFRRRGVDVLDPQAVPPAREVLRKTRRRQLTSVATAAVVAIALLAASVAGVGALLRSSEQPVPAEPPDTFTAGPLEAVPTDSRSFWSLTATADGALWWVTPGLSRFEPDSGAIRTFTLVDDPTFGDVSSIVPARASGVWMLLNSNEIRRFDGEAFHETLAPGPVCDLAEAPDGTLWGSGCLGREGVFRWDGASWVAEPSAEGLGGGQIEVDSTGRVWVQNIRLEDNGWVTQRGVSCFDGTTWTTWTDGDGIPSGIGEPIVAGPHGEVWVGTDDGVARFLNGSWVEYPGSETGIPDVWSVAETEGLVLITGYEGRRSRFALFDGSSWTSVTTEGGLGATDSGPSIAVDERGVLWAATWDAGLFRFDGSRWDRVVAPGGLSGSAGQYAAASADELWTTSEIGRSDDAYAGWVGDVWRLEDGTWSSFGEDDGVPGRTVAQIAVAPDGTAWVAAEDGLARFDGSRWKTVEPGPHQAIAFAPDGTPWTATRSSDYRALIGIGPVGGTQLPGPVPLSGSVSSFSVGAGNEIWAGCAGFRVPTDCTGALAHFDGEAWELVEVPAVNGGGNLRDFDVTPEGDVWVTTLSEDLPQGDGTITRMLTVLRYRNGTWTTFVETDAGARLDTPFPVIWEGQGTGELETTPDGDVLLLATGGLFAFGEDSWSLVSSVGFSDLTVAPDGTVWLVDGGFFQLRTP